MLAIYYCMFNKKLGVCISITPFLFSFAPTLAQYNEYIFLFVKSLQYYQYVVRVKWKIFILFYFLLRSTTSIIFFHHFSASFSFTTCWCINFITLNAKFVLQKWMSGVYYALFYWKSYMRQYIFDSLNVII